MPGITYAPARSTTSAPAGALSALAAPTHLIRPLSTIIADAAAGGFAVPSIKVKFLRTLTSAVAAKAKARIQRRGFISLRFRTRRIRPVAGLVAPAHHHALLSPS